MAREARGALGGDTAVVVSNVAPAPGPVQLTAVRFGFATVGQLARERAGLHGTIGACTPESRAMQPEPWRGA